MKSVDSTLPGQTQSTYEPHELPGGREPMSLQPPLVLYHVPNQHEYEKLQLRLQFPKDFQATLPYPDPQQSWDLTRDDLELLSIKALLTDHLASAAIILDIHLAQ